MKNHNPIPPNTEAWKGFKEAQRLTAGSWERPLHAWAATEPSGAFWAQHRCRRLQAKQQKHALLQLSWVFAEFLEEAEQLQVTQWKMNVNEDKYQRQLRALKEGTDATVALLDTTDGELEQCMTIASPWPARATPDVPRE